MVRRKEKVRKSLIYGLLNNFDLSISGDEGNQIEHLTKLLKLIQTIKLDE
jgi:hypothetical protein